MSALKTLELAIAFATRERDGAARSVVDIERLRQFGQQQMDQLQSYAADTDARWSAAGRVRVTPELMRHHYQFMGRLEHAIGLQTAAIQEQQEQLQIARRGLLAAEYRLFGLKQLLTRKRAQMQHMQARQEQKQMDEMAAQQFARVHRVLHGGDRT